MTAWSLPALADDPMGRLDPADPYPIYAELRASAPVHWSRHLNSWVLTSYEDVRAVLDHPDFRSVDPASRLSRIAERGGPPLTNLTAIFSFVTPLMDPIRSPGMKRVFFQMLTSWRQLGLRERLAERATALLEAGAATGRIDLAAGYGRELAIFAIGSLFGMPEREHDSLAVTTGIRTFVSRVVHPLRELVRLEVEAATLVDRFRALIVERRLAPANDGVSRMLQAADMELDWSDEALAGFCAFLLGAARETTSTAIGGCALRLFQEPGLRARLCENPAQRPTALRELLRLVAPFQYVPRIALRDTRIGGKSIRQGQGVCAMLAAANRDPIAFPDPDKVDLERSGPEPLTFSSGSFRCLGEQLALMELGVAIDTLLVYPDLCLGEEPVVWGASMHIRELRHVPAVFAGAEASRG
jgi:cytochrome P450